MKVYSASEAVWPALERTWHYLFRSFDLERFLKLSMVATLCEGFLISFRFYVPESFPFDVNLGAVRSFLFAPAFLPVTICAAMALFLSAVYLYFLLTRLRFAFVHSLIHQTVRMRKAARLYNLEADRFFTGCMAVWLVFLMAVAGVVVLVVISAYTVFTVRTPEGKLDAGNFLLLFLPCMGAAFLLILAAASAHVVLNDFIFPHMAIEGLTFRAAWAAARERMKANRETFLSYFILRLGMPIAASILLGLVAWLAGWLIFGLLRMSAGGFVAMLDGTSDLRAVLLIGIELFFLVLGVGAGILLAVAFGGPIGVFTRSYALVFYGGHYKPLGNLLAPEMPAADAIAYEETEQRLAG